MKQKGILNIVFFILNVHIVAAQFINNDLPLFSESTLQINEPFFRISNDYPLKKFYQKLYLLKTGKIKSVSIVHIGDSHLQSGFLTAYPRVMLQQYFGNGGRGVVFPYQIAKSTNPLDLLSSSFAEWSGTRLSYYKKAQQTGITGYVIKTTTSQATINVELKCDAENHNRPFNQISLFFDKNDQSKWVLSSGSKKYIIDPRNANKFNAYTIHLDSAIRSVSLSAEATSIEKIFYGLSLENSEGGLIYHTIGVNGAQYQQFNDAPVFWNQLPALNADLYIISLGTNEAQNPSFNAGLFSETIQRFIKNIKKASPDAEILITTAADSYVKEAPNVVLREINNFLAKYCDTKGIPCWDLYRATNAYGSCIKWNNSGLMDPDKIHFTMEGYRLQGQMLYKVLIKGYNNYLKSSLKL